MSKSVQEILRRFLYNQFMTGDCVKILRFFRKNKGQYRNIIFNRSMNIRNIIISITLFLLLSSCEEEVELEVNQRTIFMYLPWSTNLTSYFL